MKSIGQFNGTHYADEFEYPTDEPATGPHCASATGCTYQIHAQGLCRKHYTAWKKTREEETT
ncbi:hypothetical protein [Rhodococcus sp. AQ5-07]|uniref:hypothetical protein n=1 Tax=Rhodococcus sp. AQ5-07 TaxID=2054902 RepID=UPI000DBFBC4A|nr:hypothetical protein [Rhodococcus sp. AQ5-07]RAL31503.1 hypothetical protein CVN56_27775 [Rhodococcus sp. AQ5-07]